MAHAADSTTKLKLVQVESARHAPRSNSRLKPACSAATFRGPRAEIAARSGALLTAAAADVAAEAAQASARLLAGVAELHTDKRPNRGSSACGTPTRWTHRRARNSGRV